MRNQTKTIFRIPSKKGVIRRGLLKSFLLAGTLLSTSALSYSQNVWIFGNAKVNSLASGSVSNAFTSCNAIGILPGITPASLIFEPGAASPIRDMAFNTPIASQPGAETRFPFVIPGKCKHFYNVHYIPGGGTTSHYLALQEWDYSDLNGTGITAVGQPILLQQGAAAHTVGPLRPDGSRYIYAQFSQKPGGTGSETCLVRWLIAANGSIGPMVFVGDLKTLPVEFIEPRVQMELSADEQYMFYCYYPVSGSPVLVLARMDLASGVTSKIATLNSNTISGLEWVPGSAFGPTSGSRIYISWRHISTNNIGGISYYDLSTIPAGGYSGTGTNALPGSVINQYRFGFSDIERAQDNTLYFAENPNPIVVPPNPSSPGKLWRFIPATGATTALTLSGAPVQVCRVKDAWAYIIQERIDGENYTRYACNLTQPTGCYTQVGRIIPIKTANVSIASDVAQYAAGYGYQAQLYFYDINNVAYGPVNAIGTITPSTTTLQFDFTSTLPITYQAPAGGHVVKLVFVSNGNPMWTSNSFQLPLCPNLLNSSTPLSINDAIGQYEDMEDLILAPNPATHYTLAEFTLKQDSKVTIEVYNAIGQRVLNIPEMQLTMGKQRTEIPTASLSPGVYSIRISTGGNSVTRRLSVMK